ncbi:hypothetical protein EGW08_014151, partial [Elysia chlorotica]
RSLASSGRCRLPSLLRLDSASSTRPGRPSALITHTNKGGSWTLGSDQDRPSNVNSGSQALGSDLYGLSHRRAMTRRPSSASVFSQAVKDQLWRFEERSSWLTVNVDMIRDTPWACPHQSPCNIHAAGTTVLTKRAKVVSTYGVPSMASSGGFPRLGGALSLSVSSRFYSTAVLGGCCHTCLEVRRKGARKPPTNSSSPSRAMGQNSSRGSYSLGKGENPPARPQNKDTVEAVVCSTGDLDSGQMKEVEVGEHKVLLVKEGDQFYALGNKCTHYGAPLSKGSYCDGVVRCPWHGACFNVKTGDIEDFPGLDSVHTFQVEVRGSDVVVKADPVALDNFRRVKAVSRCEPSDPREVLIVGGGPASVVCTETLRQEGFTGKITLVSKETDLPYDRIKLSKTLSVKADELALRKEDFYRDRDTTVLLGKEVTKVDVDGKQVELSDGAKLPFTTLVLATGGRPRRPDIPGADLANVFTLRTVQDANAIGAKFKDKHMVVLGTSFIGLEVACAMVGHAASVSVVGNTAAPLLHVFGQEIGQWLQKLHESKGVKFYNRSSITEFEGQDGVLTAVRLQDGTQLPADACVLGVGVLPSTDFLQGSGINLTDRGYIPVDKNMRTNIPNVYAAGDITEFPLACAGDESVNIQHWQMAHQHGRTAGLDIAGKGREISSVPYFWTVQFGKSIRYAGYNHGYDDIILHGDLDDNKFVAFFTKSDRVTAAASLGWDPVVSQFAQLLAKGGALSKEEARQDPSILSDKLSKA